MGACNNAPPPGRKKWHGAGKFWHQIKILALDKKIMACYARNSIVCVYIQYCISIQLYGCTAKNAVHF